MPRTRKAAARKKKNEEDAAQKASEAAEATPKELITFVIKNLQAQMPRTIDLAIRKFDRETLRSVRQLPDKSSFPPEIWNMELSEFLRRGGEMESAMKSLREDKMKEFSSKDDEGGEDKENAKESEKEAEPPPPVAMTTRMRTRNTAFMENNDALYSETPATSTRSKRKKQKQAEPAPPPPPLPPSVDGAELMTPAVTGAFSSRTALPTTKRKPKQLEEVAIAIKSKTGSPLEEQDVMENMIVGVMDECLKDVLPSLSKKAQTQVTQAFERSISKLKGRVIRQEGDAALVTPLVTSTRARRK